MTADDLASTLADIRAPAAARNHRPHMGTWPAVTGSQEAVASGC